ASGHGHELWTRDYWAHTRGYDANRDLLYRPLTLLSFRLNHLACGDDPRGYHAVNLLLHAAVAGLVVVLASGVGCGPRAGALAGVLFAAMPIHTEAVASVVGRAELLAALFTLGVLVLVHQLGVASRGRAALWTVLMALGVLGALLSKENGVVVVLLAPLYAFSAQAPPGRLRRTLLVAAVVLAASIPYLILRYHALSGRWIQGVVSSPITNLLVDAPPHQRFWGAWQLLGMYVAKTAWPRYLCVDYSYQAFRLAASPANLHVLIGLLSGLGLVVLAVIAWVKARKLLALAAVSVLLTYLPVSNTFFLIKTSFAERVWYLPSAFVAIVVGALCAHWLCTLWRQRIGHTVLLVIVMAGLARCWDRNTDWRNNLSLFHSAYQVHPTSVPVMYCFGRCLAGYDDPRGRELLEASVRLAPGLFDAQWALGEACAKSGDVERAVRALQAAVMLQPSHPRAVMLLDEMSARLAEARSADFDRLEHDFARSGSLSDLLAWVNALLDAGRAEDAVETLAAQSERFANRCDYHHTRAVALMYRGHRMAAVEAYRAALALGGERADLLVELASVLLERGHSGDEQEGEQLIAAAIRIAPDNPQVQIARAELFTMQGRSADAARVYQDLIDHLPPGELRSTLVVRMHALRDTE
ncbi:MAG: tetratricopeptide repeat protein, partial [bacterium]|nr:tetratricopeptide repeat protein [bacterium]